MTSNDYTQRAGAYFLPDFCRLPVVFAVVVLAELFALILGLARGVPGTPQDLWTDLALTSLFMQWVAITGAAMLCLARRFLYRHGNVTAGLVGYALLLLLILLLSEAAYRAGDAFNLPIAAAGHRAFLWRNLAIGAIVSALMLRYFYVSHQSRRRLVAESEARLMALQARIRPHFLFNSMNTVASLTRSRPELAEAAVEDLSDLLRASLADGRRLLPLAEELELTRRYLHIESLRLGERLQVEWAVDDLPPDALLPPLSLQPLVENAICHGIEPRVEGGVIGIHGRRTGQRLEVTVVNPLPAPGGRVPGGNRLALDNIRQRLAFHFGAAAALETEEDGQTYRVRLRLPYRVAGEVG